MSIPIDSVSTKVLAKYCQPLRAGAVLAARSATGARRISTIGARRLRRAGDAVHAPSRRDAKGDSRARALTA